MDRIVSSPSALDWLRGVAAFAVVLSHRAFAFLLFSQPSSGVIELLAASALLGKACLSR